MAGNIAEVEASVDSLALVAWNSLVEAGHMGHTMDNILAVGGIGDGGEVPAVGAWSFGEVEGEQEVAVLTQL